MSEARPRFAHPKPGDIYLGSADVASVWARSPEASPQDFYFSPSTGHVVARHGDKPRDLKAGHNPSAFRLCQFGDPRIAEAHRRAVKAGLIRSVVLAEDSEGALELNIVEGQPPRLLAWNVEMPEEYEVAFGPLTAADLDRMIATLVEFRAAMGEGPTPSQTDPNSFTPEAP
jgi:hypothetical protein